MLSLIDHIQTLFPNQNLAKILIVIPTRKSNEIPKGDETKLILCK